MSKVLIVEDDPFYRKIYQKKFEVAGWGVAVAENGQKGLEQMRSFKPDIVFMDLMMPVMDGFSMLEKAKMETEIKDIPVVALTNLSTSGDAQEVLKKGAKAVMVKADVEPNQVVDKAKEILGL